MITEFTMQQVRIAANRLRKQGRGGPFGTLSPADAEKLLLQEIEKNPEQTHPGDPQAQAKRQMAESKAKVEALHERLQPSQSLKESDQWMPGHPQDIQTVPIMNPDGPSRVTVGTGLLGEISITEKDLEAIKKLKLKTIGGEPISAAGVPDSFSRRALNPAEGRKVLLDLPDTMGPGRDRLA